MSEFWLVALGAVGGATGTGLTGSGAGAFGGATGAGGLTGSGAGAVGGATGAGGLTGVTFDEGFVGKTTGFWGWIGAGFL